MSLAAKVSYILWIYYYPASLYLLLTTAITFTSLSFHQLSNLREYPGPPILVMLTSKPRSWKTIKVLTVVGNGLRFLSWTEYLKWPDCCGLRAQMLRKPHLQCLCSICYCLTRESWMANVRAVVWMLLLFDLVGGMIHIPGGMRANAKPPPPAPVSLPIRPKLFSLHNTYH